MSGINAELEVLLLIDEYTQRKLQVSTSDMRSNGVKVIYSLEDITEELVETYDKIIILEDYVLYENAIGNLRLYKELFGFTYIYIGYNDLWLNIMDEVVDACYKMDISKLNFQQIAAVTLNDEALIERYIVEPDTIESKLNEFKDAILEEGGFTGTIKQLYDSAVVLLNVVQDRDHRIKMLEKRNAALEVENKNSLEQTDLTFAEINRLMDSERERDEVVKQYEVILTQDVYSKISLMKYPKAPLVIYFKQYTKLNNFDWFIITLCNAIRTHTSHSCKVLKLYDSKDSIQIKLQPPGYKILRNKYTIADVESNTFLVKYGDYNGVFDIILNNKIGCDILLVFDCKCHNDKVLIGDTINYDICQSREEVNALEIDPDLCITNDDLQSPLLWNPNVTKIDQLNEKDKDLIVMAEPAIQSIIDNVSMYFEE